MKCINRQIAVVALFFSAMAFTTATNCYAVLYPVPTDLGPGDQYRLVFVTSVDRSGASSDINVFNSFVTDVANTSPDLVALETSWKAIASTHAVDARDNTETNPTVSVGVPIYNLTNIRVADNYADLWDGTLAVGSAINTTETALGKHSFVWTGTGTDGTGLIELSDTGGGLFGDSAFRNSDWISRSFYPFDRPLAFYGMSGVLTVVPEPSSALLGAFGIAALVALRLLRLKR